jgi:hypothetical protein
MVLVSIDHHLVQLVHDLEVAVVVQVEEDLKILPEVRAILVM